VSLRCLIAALVFVPVLGFTSRLVVLVSPPARWPAAASCISFAAAVTLSQAGYGLTAVTNAGFFINTTTVITPILACLILKQRPHKVTWLAALLIFAGAVLMSGGSLHGFRAGDALCLASAVCYAFWMIFVGDYAEKGGDASALTLLQFAFTAAVCLPLALYFEPVTLPGVVRAVPELLFLGLFSTAGAYFLQILAQQHTSASEAAIIGSGEAVVGAIAAYFLLDEVLTTTGALGALVISAGIVLVQFPALLANVLSRDAAETTAASRSHPRAINLSRGQGSLLVPVPSRSHHNANKRRFE
jgi:drug/metabolite transporter (DMT)-like permease